MTPEGRNGALSAGQPKPPLRGRFITFEGIDGCGKTTQATRLAERLRERQIPVAGTREPGGTSIGQQVRAVLLSPDNAAMEPSCELLLYLADRVQHLAQVIRPALERGEVVVCDRFHDATVAYQHYGRGLELTPLQGFIDAEILSTAPDLTFWLDLDVKSAGIRRASRNPPGQLPLMEGFVAEVPEKEIAKRSRAQSAEMNESRLDALAVDFHQRVREGYAAICRAEPQRVQRIEAAGDHDTLHGEIWRLLEARYDVV